MKVINILPIIVAFCISVSVVEAAINSFTHNKEVISNKSMVNPSVSGMNTDAATEINKGIAGISAKTTLMAHGEDYSYLRFDVTRYADPEKDINSEVYVAPNSSVAEFDYLKFDVKKYADPDNMSQDDIDEILPSDDFSYLKFDVAKYAGNDESTDYDSVDSFSGR